MNRDPASKLIPEDQAPHESDTYLMILEEGENRHAKKLILRVGEKRLGLPDEDVKTCLASITDLERLDRMLLQAFTAASWQEILDTH